MGNITFLGTGTSGGVPIIGCDCEVCKSTDKKDNRLRSSVLIEIDGLNIVIDSSMDFRYQMLRENVRRIDAIIYTHSHKDHIGGLDDVRAFNYIMNKSINLFGEEAVLEILKKDFDYAFIKHSYLVVPQINLNKIDETPFFVEGLEIIPIRGMHYKLPVLGYRIGKICYITDMNFIEDSEIEKIKGVEILVINSLRFEKHYSHFNLEESLEVISKVKPKKAYLTHIAHEFGLYKETSKLLPEGVEMAWDGLKVKF